MEKSVEVSKKTKNKTAIYLVISLLGIYLKECKSAYNSDTFTPIFIAVLFTIVKLWNHPRCP
jgi:hypothetical protein